MLSARRVLAVLVATAILVGLGGARGSEAEGIDRGADGAAAARRIP